MTLIINPNMLSINDTQIEFKRVYVLSSDEGKENLAELSWIDKLSISINWGMKPRKKMSLSDVFNGKRTSA